MAKNKISSQIYEAQRVGSKIARTLNNLEDLSQGRVDKVAKRETRHVVRKEANKALNKLFRKIGL